jgi:hypothetical protein
MIIDIPIRVVSEANSREHWHKKARRHHDQKIAVANYYDSLPIKPTLPCHVSLIRVAPRKLDFDNLVSAFKYIRDAISEKLTGDPRAGRSDDDPRIEWSYKQQSGGSKIYAIKIEIVAKA